MKAIHVSLLLVFLFTSCKDEMLTQGELAAKKIKADISLMSASITDISAVDNGTLVFSGSSYMFKSDGFIMIITTTGSWRTFNLNELKSYSITGSDSSHLSLYF